MERLPSPLAGFSWATAGRPETEAELLFKWRQQRNAMDSFSRPLKFTIVVRGEGDLRTWASIQSQSFPSWEVFWVSKEEPAFPVRWVRENEPLRGISGDWVCSLNAGDVLSPVALYLVANEIERSPDLNLIFSHEKTSDGRFFSKSAFSIFNVWHFDAIGAAWWMRRTEWELHATKFKNIAPDHARLLPFFLLYRGSGPALGPVPNPVVDFPAEIYREEGRVKILPKVERKKITAIICFRDRADWTMECLRHLSQRAMGMDLEILLVDNQSQAMERAKVEAVAERMPHVSRFIDYRKAFNFAAMHNLAVASATGEYVLVLNNDVFWTKGSLAEMVAWAQFDWVGTVGMTLRFPHGGIQHGGLRAFFGGAARVARLGHETGAHELSLQSREVFGNTFAACLFRKDRYEAIGGLRDRDLPNGFGDVAFNFECRRRGWKNLFLGHFEGTHLESGSRGSVYEYWEENFIEREYPEILQAMLREDLGFDRIPAADLSVTDFARDWTLTTVRQKLPWLKPLKEQAKKQLREFGFHRLIPEN